MPSWRTLSVPLARGALAVLLLSLPALVIHALSSGVTLVPMVDELELLLSFATLATFALVALFVVTRVGPLWRGTRLRSKLLYVAALIVAHACVVLAAEASSFYARGGLRLFEPTLQESSRAPDGRTAYVYREGLGCKYIVYVARPWSLTMDRALELPRRHCGEPLPRVAWRADGTLLLTDEAGVPLAPEQPEPWFHFGGGC